MGFFDRLRDGLSKTRKGFIEKVESVFLGRAVTEETLEELEEILITSDVGVKATGEILDFLRKKESEIRKSGSARDYLKAEMTELLGKPERLVVYGEKPFVILAVGVNGVGKTTTIGKLASRFASEGKSVIIGAAD